MFTRPVHGGLHLAIAGGCLCRAVRFEIDADAPLGARYCWCRVCQYLGAGTGAVSALFRKESVTVSGPLTDHVIRADSGAIMHRRFCSQCGTPCYVFELEGSKILEATCLVCGNDEVALFNLGEEAGPDDD